MAGETCIMLSVLICTFHQITLLWWWNQGSEHRREMQ